MKQHRLKLEIKIENVGNTQQSRQHLWRNKLLTFQTIDSSTEMVKQDSFVHSPLLKTNLLSHFPTFEGSHALEIN